MLIEELNRFDIRSEIAEVDSIKALKQNLKSFQPDLVILLGVRKSIKGIRLAERKGIRRCFFYMSLLDSYSCLITSSKSRKVYQDMPSIDQKNDGEGSLLSDLIRKIDRGEDETSSKEVQIGIVGLSVGRAELRFSENISKIRSNYHFQMIDCSSNLDDAISKIERSNAVIALDQFSNVLTALSNVPLVNVYRSGIIRKTSNRKSSISELLQDKIVKNLRISNQEAIANELDLILSDHHYSAGILEKYQVFRSKIGNKPFARQAAQEIVEWLED